MQQGVGERRAEARRRSTRLVELVASAFVVLVVAVAAVLLAFGLRREAVHLVDLERWAVLAGVGVGYVEVSRREVFLRRLIGGSAPTNMNSLWLVAGAVLLPLGLALSLVVADLGFMWWRVSRRVVTARLYRHIFTGATVVIGCAAAHQLASFAIDAHSGLLGTIWLAAGVLAYRVANGLLIATAIALTASPRRLVSLFGGPADNALEFASAGLGVAAALLMPRGLGYIVFLLPAAVLLQRNALITQLAHRADTDTKTGLLNAGAWTDRAEGLLARAIHRNYNGAVLLIDLDHFKAVNDTHGHLAGDATLSAVAGCLKQVLRGQDVIGRYGGEEFAVLLDDIEATDALVIADRLRAGIAQLCIPSADTGRPITVTTSIGLAFYPNHGTLLEPLLRTADRALYAAKANGRNQVSAVTP